MGTDIKNNIVKDDRSLRALHKKFIIPPISTFIKIFPAKKAVELAEKDPFFPTRFPIALEI